MGRRRKFGRSVHGVVVVDKDPGMTSNDVVQKIKKLFFANKVGHTGSLDPLATGVLPICLGESTKFAQYLLDADKGYECEFILGETRNTGDADGETVDTKDASCVTQDQLEQAMLTFMGDIKQVPPMYSALKRDGQPLYKLARKGIEVEREARPVTIHSIELLSFKSGVQAVAKMSVTCSKGTYIRSLVEDIGSSLGVGGHVTALRRTLAGSFKLPGSYTLSALAQMRGEEQAEALDHTLLAVDSPIETLPKIVITDDSGYYFKQGQAVMDMQVYQLGESNDRLRVYTESGEFLGVGDITDEGTVAPKRLVVY